MCSSDLAALLVGSALRWREHGVDFGEGVAPACAVDAGVVQAGWPFLAGSAVWLWRWALHPEHRGPKWVDVANRLDVGFWPAGAAAAAGPDGRAWPTGTRFQLLVASTQAGRLQLSTLGPSALAVPAAVWAGDVPAMGSVATPMLRLDGALGMEQLCVALVHAGNHVLARRVVEVLHL